MPYYSLLILVSIAILFPKKAMSQGQPEGAQLPKLELALKGNCHSEGIPSVNGSTEPVGTMKVFKSTSETSFYLLIDNGKRVGPRSLVTTLEMSLKESGQSHFVKCGTVPRCQRMDRVPVCIVKLTARGQLAQLDGDLVELTQPMGNSTSLIFSPGSQRLRMMTGTDVFDRLTEVTTTTISRSQAADFTSYLSKRSEVLDCHRIGRIEGSVDEPCTLDFTKSLPPSIPPRPSQQPHRKVQLQ